ncbi:Aldehyde ferredoxin oxidoreductase [Desulfotomaculum nigrificans CO-1-SRB]|uniref:Aldehyde ferredoxin oxidoreductase n=1 Tax=Desulfotomaculum nigrificans (strain DSM 14880 / VKM B-2319 / CO-1-SRB) TaxID=868595 RepID=F6B4D6_DESCC|nr:aldehyde ferredoxin oxidoreductase C-terminal domain-containing protein [Desulfotomaculum nigrificans]AEF95313.1 Aldehyde ferredoxin oxidoreductase [Desulfotomaculum nigrificans CO-1-SRB]
MNKILRVNMKELTVKAEPTRKEYQFLGGRALIARLLLDEVKPACEPLGRHNKLIFAPGLLGGSKVPSSGRISIGGKSPLTGGIKESNGGGVVGLKLGRLGYKAVIIEEIPRNEEKYLLKITADGAELIPAGEYWGLGVYQTAALLRQQFGDKVAVSCIGPAGEKKLAAAGIANTDTNGVPSRYSGRGGLGAVMGAKGIKAVIIDDSNSGAGEPANPEQYKEALRQYSRILKESPVIKTYTDYGTAAMVQVTNAIGGLPTRNFTTGHFEGAEKISGEALRETILARQGKTRHNCMPGCLIGCSNVYVDAAGKEIVSPLEYETIALMGSNLDIHDLDAIARLNYLCNDYGLDTIETGAALGVAMAGGVIPFGDKQGAINLVHEIGKGTILGRVLGMGAQIAGKVLGVINVPAVKGQAMAAYDPRAIKGVGVTYATSPMGADHTAGNTVRNQVDHHSAQGQAELSAKSQYTVPVYDALGLCLFTSAGIGASPEVLCQLVNAQLGTDFTPETLFKMAADTVKWEREFNQQAGFTKYDDRLPEYFYETPNPATNTVFDVSDEEMDQVHK